MVLGPKIWFAVSKNAYKGPLIAIMITAKTHGVFLLMEN